MWLPFTQDKHSQQQQQQQREREMKKSALIHCFCLLWRQPLFCLSVYVHTIAIEQQERRCRRSEPKPSRQVHNRRFDALFLCLAVLLSPFIHIYMVLAPYCFFLSHSCLYHLADSTLRWFSWSMYTRRNVLAVFVSWRARGKNSFSSFLDIQNAVFCRFLPSFAFVYFRYMNERHHIALFFLSSWLCLQNEEEKTSMSSRLPVRFFTLTFLFRLCFMRSIRVVFCSHHKYVFFPSSPCMRVSVYAEQKTNYVIILTIIRESSLSKPK